MKKQQKVTFAQFVPLTRWIYDKHLNYGGLWFQWWKSKGEKSWEKYLDDYYKKFEQASK